MESVSNGILVELTYMTIGIILYVPKGCSVRHLDLSHLTHLLDIIQNLRLNYKFVTFGY